MPSIAAELDESDMLLVLVSADLLSCPHRWPALLRILASFPTERPTVVPVLLRSCNWEQTPLCNRSPLPSNGVPIQQWPDQDAAWLAVVRGLRQLQQPLTIRLWVERDDAPLQRTRDIELIPRDVQAGSFEVGSRIRIGFQASRDAYVVLLNRGTSGRVRQICPQPGTNAVYCQGALVHYFPRPEDLFEFALQGQAGHETLYALANFLPTRLMPQELEQVTMNFAPASWVEARCSFEVRTR